MEVGVHARFEHGNAAEALELGGVGFVVEGAGDQHVEGAVGGLAGGCDQIGAGDGAELGADEDGGAAIDAVLLAALVVAALGADMMAGPRG